MVTINNRKFANSKKAFRDSLLTNDPCNGYYKKLKNGIRIYDQNGEAFIFVFDNWRSDRGIVSCTKKGSGYIYMYSTTTLDEKKLGFDHGISYKTGVELADKLLNKIFQNKYTAEKA